jgi:hypothetical protein
MRIFRDHAIGLVLAAGALLVANTSDAKVPMAPLTSATAITQVAQGCGPGGFRGPTAAVSMAVMVTVMAMVTVARVRMATQTPIALI